LTTIDQHYSGQFLWFKQKGFNVAISKLACFSVLRWMSSIIEANNAAIRFDTNTSHLVAFFV